MKIAGTGITAFTQEISWGFTPLTTLAIEWMQSSDNNWFGIDRTSAEDVYESNINIYGTETEVDTFIDWFEANRAEDHELYLYDLNAGEKIFGADVAEEVHAIPVVGNESGYKVNMVLGKKYQGSLNGFGLDVKVRNISLAFTGTSSIPILRPIVGYDADSEYTINNVYSYNGTVTYIDRDMDIGTFSGVCRLSNSDMVSMRTAIRTIRAGNATVEDGTTSGLKGVDNPFGRRSGGYPYTCKIIDWEDQGQADHAGKYWNLQITFAEVI